MENKKAIKTYEELLSRQSYLVVQGNDLAKAFGNLTAFEHKLLDYCFSYVTKDSQYSDRFEVNTIEVFKHFGMHKTGDNYERVVRAFKRLNENTALYLPWTAPDGTEAIMMTQLFGYIAFDKKGRVYFEFSKYALPLVFDLKKNFYSFQLAELAQVKGKYALILLKLWEGHRFGKNPVTVISGNLEQWQGWFLAKERRLTPSTFKRDIIRRAAEELEMKFNVSITLTTEKKGRKVVGYEMEIIDKRVYNPATNENEVQTSIYDFLEE